MKKILMLLEKHFPEDERVEKEAISLIEKGYEVHIASMCVKPPVEFEIYKGIHVHRKYIGPWLKKTSVGALKAPFYFNYWRQFVREILESDSFHAIHVHDLPLGQVGYEAKQKYNIKYVLDLHEHWPALLEASPHTHTFLGRLLSSNKQWEDYEVKMSQRADRIIVVVEEAIDRLAGLGISAEKITCVSNTISIEGSDWGELADHSGKEKIMGYAGGIQHLRGLQYVIQAMPILLRENPDIKLWIVGDGRHLSVLKESCQGALEHSVRFFGHLSFHEMMNKINYFDIGLIPHLKSPLTDNTIPNKLFQYMYLQKPVLTSDCDPLKRIVEETQSGLAYPYDSPEALAEKALILLSDDEKALTFGKNGKQAVETKYNWEHDSARLVELYDQLL
ncbi:MAG: glycosyltransferase family 4 protein [Lewinellaceae bacterium]|nr:glycosyltransferase family 4 protein [Phaeodactylibacter sp.]MCB0562179.1 glycosyltransferase family 4 protein [Phaeodactylibacter sp.]MCB0614512.1 glycosyltransferase family 4 protein [Phaeodactylibacter sp.]MCB9350169.1 glycosyltransferase family 4 protein [Lewinellaceae bacterium]